MNRLFEKIIMSAVVMIGLLTWVGFGGRNGPDSRALPYNQLFVTESAVWVAGRLGILRSTDGGATWKALTDRLPPRILDPALGSPFDYLLERPLVSAAHFSSALEGWVVCRDKWVFRTSDGGASWVDVTPKVDGYRIDVGGRFHSWIADSHFLSPLAAWVELGWAHGGDEPSLVSRRSDSSRPRRALYRTTDGGETWQLLLDQKTYAARVSHFYFRSSTTGFAISGNFNLVKTLDGGVSWTPLTSQKQLSGPERTHEPPERFSNLCFVFTPMGRAVGLDRGGRIAVIEPSGEVTAVRPDRPALGEGLDFKGLWLGEGNTLFAVAVVKSDDPELFMGAHAFRGLLFRSRPPYEQWEPVLQQQDGIWLVAATDLSGRLWALSVEPLPEARGALLVSVEEGDTWTHVSSLPPPPEYLPPAIYQTPQHGF